MSETKSMDGSDGLVLTPDHSITVCKFAQQKPKLQGDGVADPFNHAVQTTATSGVQSINQGGEIEVSCHDSKI